MSFEVVVRPAGIVAVLKEKPNQQPIATQDDEAYIEWGRGSLNLSDRSTAGDTDFNWEEQFPDIPQIPDPATPEGQQTPTFVFNEVARQTHVVRITQDGKPENYVDVEVIDAIAFNGPAGVYVYRFTNKQ